MMNSGFQIAQVGAESGGRFVFGAVHPDLAPLVLAGDQGDPAALGAAQVAAGETAVHAPVVEEVVGVVFAADLVGLRIGAELVVLHRQGVVLRACS